MQYDADQRTVDLHAGAAVVVNESQFAKPIEKKADAGASGADHLGESLLTDARTDRLRAAF